MENDNQSKDPKVVAFKAAKKPFVPKVEKADFINCDVCSHEDGRFFVRASLTEDGTEYFTHLMCANETCNAVIDLIEG